jgi:two-component system, OmpR family, response regulator
VRLLVVEDEPKMSDLLKRALTREGYAVDIAENGTDALWLATEASYDAIVLDVMIPAPDGFTVAKELRGRGRWAPILFLTARDAIDDRVSGLDAGGDDYLVKPFALAELFARLRALTRRESTERPVVLQVGDLELDPASRRVSRAGTLIELSPTEFSLLEQFMRAPNTVLTRSVLLEKVWDFAYDGTSNVVDVYVRYLREKVDRPFGASGLETVRGVGYVLRESFADPAGATPEGVSAHEDASASAPD